MNAIPQPQNYITGEVKTTVNKSKGYSNPQRLLLISILSKWKYINNTNNNH